LATIVLIVAAKTAMAQDPVKVEPNTSTVLLENDRVRVLDVQIKPGEKTAMHSHPAALVYPFSTSNQSSRRPVKMMK
jgi:quercetin dioxygenase-like cupin family protein